MNAPAQPVPAPNGYPSMNVVRALARASKRVAEVTCLGRSGDPRDPYAYARADDVVSAAKEAIQAEGLVVLPASSDQKAEPVDPRESVIWLRQTFNVIHEPTGEWLPFQADPWPLQKGKPLDKAMATAKTASKAYFYLSLLEIRRVGPNAEDMDADLPPVEQKPAETPKPVTDSTQMGVSAKAKRSGAAVHAAMRRDAESRPKVSEEENAAELARFAASNFPTEGDQTMPPTPASALLQSIPGLQKGLDLVARLSDALEVTAAQQNNEGESSSAARLDGSPASPGALPGGASSQPDSGNPGTSLGGPCKRAPESTPAATSTAGASHSVSSAGDSASPSESPAPGPSEPLTEEDWGSTPQRGRPVSAKAPSEPPKRKAQGVNWAKATTRKARQAFWCAECQPEDASGPTLGGDHRRAIQPKAEHRDSGNGPRLCLACWGRMETEADGAGARGVA